MRGQSVLFASARVAAAKESGASTDDLRDVLGYEGLYQVTRDGRIFRVSTYDGRPCFKPCAITKGRKYLRVHLCRDGVGSKINLHSIVASAFLGPRPKGKECAHLDGDRSNNHASNLAWKTHRENEADKILHGTRIPKRKAA